MGTPDCRKLGTSEFTVKIAQNPSCSPLPSIRIVDCPYSAVSTPTAEIYYRHLPANFRNLCEQQQHTDGTNDTNDNINYLST